MEGNIKIVLKYLKDKDCIESFLTLERETGVRLVNYSKEIQFFKKIILKGDFNEAVNFLTTFQNRVQEAQFKKIILDIYKQKLCELIENPNEQELKLLFERDLITCCSEEEYQELFNYLTFRSVSQIQDMDKWTVLRGRYQCFQSIVPYLEVFNSVVKHEEPTDSLEDILELYQKNKGSLKESFTFNRKNLQSELPSESFQKNKSLAIPTLTFNPAHQHSSSQDSDHKAKAENESSLKEKQIIKNSIANMSISGNYSQMKSKLLAGSIKQNVSSFEENQSKFIPIDQKSRMPQDKSQVYGEKSALGGQKSQYAPSLRDSAVGLKDRSSFVQEKRPRVNASLNGPMNRQKLEGSVKVDNFMKNQQKLQSEQNHSKYFKNQKIQKSAVMSNQSGYSHMAKSSKPDNSSKVAQNKLEHPPLAYGHFNNTSLTSSQLKQIEQEDHSDATKSIKNEKPKYSYLMDKHEEDDLEEEVRRNIQYLQQTSSVIYNKSQLENQGFNFSNNKEDKEFRVKNVVKLAATTDSKAIRTCQFSDSGELFAVGTNSSILKIFDVQNLFHRNKFQQINPIYQIDSLHLKSIFCLHWHSNERSLVTCSNDLNIKLTQISKSFNDHKTTVIGKHQSCIRMVKFSPSETKVVSCGDDNCIRVWDLTKAKKSTTMKSHIGSISAFKFQNQNELYSVSKDQTIKKWDLRMNQNVATSKHQESELTFIASNTEDIVVSHKNGTVSFFSPTLQLIHSVQIHEQEIRSIDALKQDNVLLTASFDGHVALFNEFSAHQPSYFQHNQTGEDKVVYATFLNSPYFRGFSSTSTQGLCHIYSYT